VEAFGSGDAPPPLPWAPEGRADYNRAVFLNLLGTHWLPAIPAVHQRLLGEPPAAVADLACGAGWSSIAMAHAYPLIRVDGFDLDSDVIAVARRNATQAGVAGRVNFAVTDASGPGMSGRYDLVTIFEGLHDMSRPVDALRAARGMLGRTGSVIIADELVEDEFTAPATELERYHYGWSVVSCLPSAMGDRRTSATGAVMRPATLRRYAQQAGFASVEVLPLETETGLLPADPMTQSSSHKRRRRRHFMPAARSRPAVTASHQSPWSRSKPWRPAKRPCTSLLAGGPA
jgi:2-polyprenyl-3-methyl-5-hydroxy-6-metoxy-1,4-benzoquinol methylase